MVDALPDRMGSARLELRRVRADDVTELVSLVDESFETLHRWMPWAAEPYTLAKAEDFVAHCDDGWVRHTEFNYGIVSSGRLVGVCGARPTPASGLDVGYWLSDSFTGRGLVKEAVHLLIVHGFDDPSIDHIEIWHDVANARSRAVAVRLGFRHEATTSPSREPMTPGKEGVDVVWRLDRTTWDRQRATRTP